MDIINIVLQLILSLSILVTLHECGHFFPARWFNTRVEKFYLFFNPGFSLFKKKIGETEYGLGWIPFGGYVKIAGMIDESMDKEQMKRPVQPWEFRAKPAWQRLIIMIGGVTVNFILGFLIFAGMLYYYGTSYIKADSVKHGILVEELGKELGLQNGDKILKIGEKDFEKFDPSFLMKEIVFDNPSHILVERNGVETKLPIPEGMAKTMTKHENKGKGIFSLLIPLEVTEYAEKGPAYKAGMRNGDKIISINNKDVTYRHQLQELLNNKDLNTLTVLADRSGEVKTFDVVLEEKRQLGVQLVNPNTYLEMESQTYGLGESLTGGVKMGVNFLKSQIAAFGKIFKNEISAKDNLGSIVSIASMFDKSWNWQKFWHITAVLSILLGFFNLLPIPALDGGYVLFLLWEVITGRKVSDKVMEYANTIGFFILITLMISALALDFSRFF